MAELPNGQHLYTQEEDAWLTEHIDDGTWQEITEMFNNMFGTNIKSISDRALKRLHLKKSVNRGDVKKGERRCTNTLPVWSERWNGHDVYIKISDNVNDCKNRRMPSKSSDRNWMRKDHLVWTSCGNPMPKSNEMLIHLNGDKQDCSIENLYLTDRKINLMMAKNNWHSTDRNITLAGIKWCEMYYAMRDVGELPVLDSVKQAKKEYHKKWSAENKERLAMYRREYQRRYREKKTNEKGAKHERHGNM